MPTDVTLPLTPKREEVVAISVINHEGKLHKIPCTGAGFPGQKEQVEAAFAEVTRDFRRWKELEQGIHTEQGGEQPLTVALVHPTELEERLKGRFLPEVIQAFRLRKVSGIYGEETLYLITASWDQPDQPLDLGEVSRHEWGHYLDDLYHQASIGTYENGFFTQSIQDSLFSHWLEGLRRADTTPAEVMAYNCNYRSRLRGVRVREDYRVIPYEVKGGDCLSRIAERFGLSHWQPIVDLNQPLIRDPDRIQAGWRIQIPQTKRIDLIEEMRALEGKISRAFPSIYGATGYQLGDELDMKILFCEYWAEMTEAYFDPARRDSFRSLDPNGYAAIECFHTFSARGLSLEAAQKKIETLLTAPWQ